MKHWIFRVCRFVAATQAVIPGAVAATLAIGIWQWGGWQPWEEIGYNYLFQIRESGILSQASWDETIAIIAIDNASLEKYGSFPWSRERYAQLLQALEPSPPAVIGFDLLFVDPGEGDSEFANAIAKAGNVVLATAWDGQGEPLEPLPELKQASASVGQIWHNPDPDGISRRAAVFAKGIPGLGVAMTQIADGDQAETLPQPMAGKQQQLIWLNWMQRAEALPTYSFADVVEGKVASDALADKVVLVGVTATGIDTLRSPLDQQPPISGVYLHATLIDNLRQSRELHPLAESLILLLLLVLGLGSSWVFSNHGIKSRMAIALLFPVIWLGIAAAAFSYSHQWFPIAAPIGTGLLTLAGVQLREKYQLMRLFETYVAPKTAQLIWQQQSQVCPFDANPSQQTTATILFMDIRGFTTISERMTPAELYSWLNPYLETMTNCIMDHDGIVDKYIGDAIMAVFGVSHEGLTSETIRDGASKAIAACLEMNRCLALLNQRFQQEGKPLIEVGIGVHTGLVVAGSLGSKRRLNYSVLGDAVNIASRLQSLNKNVTDDNPHHILISSSTYDYVRDRYQAKPIKSIKLRGRKQKTLIYSVLGQKPQIQPQPDSYTQSAAVLSSLQIFL